MKFAFIVFLLLFQRVTYGAVVIQQDFESSQYFTIDQPFGENGVGDGATIVGLWKNPQTNGNFAPKIAPENSTFSNGGKSVLLTRTDVYGSGFLVGKRTNIVLEEHFDIEFSIKPARLVAGNEYVDFAIYLVDANSYFGNEVGVAYASGLLHTFDQGQPKAKSGIFTPGNWYRIKITGNLVTGLYNAYIDFGVVNNWVGWQPLAVNQGFDTAKFKNIAGIYFVPWTLNHLLCVDDIKISGDVYSPASCMELIASKINSDADINGDCRINLADFAIFAANWLKYNGPGNPSCD